MPFEPPMLRQTGTMFISRTTGNPSLSRGVLRGRLPSLGRKNHEDLCPTGWPTWDGPNSTRQAGSHCPSAGFRTSASRPSPKGSSHLIQRGTPHGTGLELGYEVGCCIAGCDVSRTNLEPRSLAHSSLSKHLSHEQVRWTRTDPATQTVSEEYIYGHNMAWAAMRRARE
jgi:hypothetical protein